jgi:hypothetical protein
MLPVFLVHCDTNETIQSTPVQSKEEAASEEGSAVLPVPIAGPKPVSLAKLQGRWPQIQSLTVEQNRLFSATFNLLPAPCEQCDGKTLAECGTTTESLSCSGMERIARRTIEGIRAGWAGDRIRLHANYPDLWFEGLEGADGVDLHLYRDADGLFADETEAVRKGLVDNFGTALTWTLHEANEDAPDSLGVRSRPTWFINGFRFRGVQSVNTLTRFIGYEIEDNVHWEQ